MADPLAAGFPNPGDTVLVALSWVGNNYFGHEALRRGEATPPFTIVVVSALEGNVWHGVITAESVEL